MTGTGRPATSSLCDPQARPDRHSGPVSSVVILGSTGSIGTQAVDLALHYPDRLRVAGLAATGRNPDLLAEQAHRLDVATVAVARPATVPALRAALRSRYGPGRFLPEIIAGPGAAAELASAPCDRVLNGITGSIGLGPTLAALRAGRILALANKESLVAGGPLVAELARPGQLIPVDSEHSAIFQCLAGATHGQVRRLVLTASGGPFRGRSRRELDKVTPDQALAHPTWTMGPVVTVNSATLMNKGLEVIEAHLLFGIPYDRIHVVVHPQSYAHAMVEFTDGSTLVQAGPPDMRIPIALGLSWPDRLPAVTPPVDWEGPHNWQFEPLDHDAFPAVRLAGLAGSLAGTAPAALNAANEECVEAFLAGDLTFTQIIDVVAEVLASHSAPRAGLAIDLETVLAVDGWARRRARRWIKRLRRTGR
ncbi:1-deoxy-D-xylulose-5-phosphate reductoisomerase [Kitasatospora sp. NBC_00070]|uniref:1-deoxy-D-xylulose-5-phosphate reductoisomerase n=1 Tax=Kitasatospora sp. NBC_00070 TaxID=2975962 RepID=UPI00324AB7D0